MPVEVYADGLTERRFPADVEGAAYFVVCEALTNMIKHAAASSVAVDLSAVDGHLTVRVSDDGTGAGPSSRSGHGLTNLRDRVEALGGRLRVDGSPGEGTRLSVDQPLAAGHG